nr:Unknown Function [uncultured bacterium]
MNRTDAQELKELIDATENEDLRATANIVAETTKEMLAKARELHEILRKLVSGRENIAGEQLRTELALYDRIQAMSQSAQSPEDLLTLATTYVQLRSVSVAPGWYDPDTRHSGTDGLTAD